MGPSRFHRHCAVKRSSTAFWTETSRIWLILLRAGHLFRQGFHPSLPWFQDPISSITRPSQISLLPPSHICCVLCQANSSSDNRHYQTPDTPTDLQSKVPLNLTSAPFTWLTHAWTSFPIRGPPFFRLFWRKRRFLMTSSFCQMTMVQSYLTM